MRSLLLLCALACAGTSAAAAQSDSIRVPMIATNGRGEVHVAPDQAVLMVGIESRSPSAATASADDAVRVTRTIAGVRAAGVDSAQITTSGYSVSQEYDSKGKPNGFLARNNLRIELRRIADVGKVIDAALQSGATQVYQIQFLRSNSIDARRSALTLAVAEAKRDAETLAQAAGGTLGALISLTSGSVVAPLSLDVQVTGQLESRMSAGTPVMPGELSVSAVASGRWQFVPRR